MRFQRLFQDFLLHFKTWPYPPELRLIIFRKTKHFRIDVPQNERPFFYPADLT